MQIWGLTDAGNVRRQNQDSFSIVNFSRERALMIVCDGMGGAKSGNVASSLAVEVFVGEVRRSQKNATSPERAAEMLKSALELANKAVYEQAQLGEDYEGMGTTLVAAFILRETAVIINVGDSRAYLFTKNGVKRLTTDHSIVEYMVQRGELTQEQAKNHPGKNLITRAVGTEPEVEGDIFVRKLQKDDCLLLCSDGLSNEMADQEMLFEVAHGVRRSDCCQRLLNIAKNRGAPDNVTLTLAAI
ncbi:MAG: Stp1/IreP family PP2C-type Ser/Thr phosphatase [Clostridiales bacterium]|nr:Stp1/IreP family PP2C-type Ser/Thr phosphatase [Clostridiales bacterium]